MESKQDNPDPRMTRMVSEALSDKINGSESESQRRFVRHYSSASSMGGDMEGGGGGYHGYNGGGKDIRRAPIETHRYSLNLVRGNFDDRRLSRDVTFSVPYDEVKKSVNDAIYKNDVVVFIKPACPFCTEMVRTLDSYGVVYAVFDVSRSGNAAAIQSELTQTFGFGTVPHLFVERRSVGGCSDLKSLEHAGVLMAQLGPYMCKHAPREERAASLGFLWFPAVVDRYNTRLVAVFTALYCLLCIGFFNRSATSYCVLALALDFALRCCFGGFYSVGGVVAAVLLSRVEPSFTAGAPKQFAAFCGLFFSTFAAGLYLGGFPRGGAVVMALLMCAAAIEALLDFCFGCWMFSLLISFGAVNSSIYRPYLNTADDKKWAYMFDNAHRRFPAAKREHVLLPWQEQPTAADLIRKNRIESEFKSNDVSFIRHARVDLFSAPMTIAALAYVFKLAGGADDAVRFNTGVASQVLAITAVLLFIPLLLLFLLRAVQYPRKLLKEWQHPITGNFFATISITVILFGLLLFPQSENAGITFVWIGAIAQLLLVILRLAELVFDFLGRELVNPSLMLSPVGSYIAAIGFATFENTYDGSDRNGKMSYVQIARLWFGVAALFTPVLFTITFKKALHESHADNRLRPLLWVWLATFSLAGPALLAVAGGGNEDSSAAAAAVGRDVLFQSLWCISLFLFVVCGSGFLRNFFTYTQDMSIWVMAFSLTAFALSTVQYYAVIQDQLFMALAVIAITVASVVTAICGCYTMTWLLTLRLFKPRTKWGPVSFFKLTHECFRFAIPKYVAIADSLQAENTFALIQLTKELQQLFCVFLEHSRHEDSVLFPRLRRYFPDLNTDADEEHELQHGMVMQMQQALDEFSSAVANSAGFTTSTTAVNAAAGATAGAVVEVNDDDVEQAKGGDAAAASAVIKPTKEEAAAAAEAGSALLKCLQQLLPEWETHVLPHLRSEEVTFTVAARKYLPLDEQVKIAAAAFALTGSHEWRLCLPFVINNLPSDQWKARYVKAFVWAVPARAQEIGLMIYHGVDSITWLMLCREIPSISPRGDSGHKRIY